MTDYNIVYKSVLEKVKQGVTITNALKVLKINSYDFYYNITGGQKKELLLYKTLNTKTSGYGSNYYNLVPTGNNEY